MTAWQKFQKLIMIEQTIFGASWVLVAFVFAHLKHPHLPLFSFALVWVALAFLSARSLGMALNRITDRKIDAQNPRTRNRLIPSGKMSLFQVAVFALAAAFSLLLSAVALGPKILFSLPVMFFFLITYAYTKRWTPFCHFFLGITCGLAPFFSYVALAQEISLPPFLLALACGSLIAANDIIYALQDLDFDKAHRVYSFPAIYGQKKSLSCVRYLYLVALIAIFSVGFTIEASLVSASVVVLAPLFYYFLSLLGGDKTVDVNPLFFKSNAYSGCVLLIFSLGGWLWNGF